MPIKEIEVRVEPAIRTVEASGGLPGPAGVSITDAEVDGSGHLILTLSNGVVIDAGEVKGPPGDEGQPGLSVVDADVDVNGDLILTLSDASTINAGHVVGPQGDQGDQGDQGVSITGATVDGSYHLILSLSNGGTIDAGYVRGPAGAGTGDVLGPTSSVTGNFAIFNDTTGKLIGDSGVSAASFATAAQGTKADTAIQSISSTGSGLNVDNSAPTAPVLSLDATLEAVANFATGANKVMYWTGTDTLGSFDTTTFTRSFMGSADEAAARAVLLLGTAALLTAGAAAGNIPVLDGSGKLETSILPALAITSRFVVNSEASMLALAAQEGDIAIRTDISTTFILGTNDPSVLANWSELLSPTDGITSVAGLTGPVIGAAALRTALDLVIGEDVQAWSTILDAFVALSPTDDDFLQRKAGAWTNRTIAQVIADLIAGGVFTSRTLPDPTLTNAITVESYAFNTSTNAAVDLANGTQQIATLTGNWTPSAWPAATTGQFFELILKQDATGSRTVTWDASVKWPASTAPTITATASKGDIIHFRSDGTNWLGNVVGQVYF